VYHKIHALLIFLRDVKKQTFRKAFHTFNFKILQPKQGPNDQVVVVSPSYFGVEEIPLPKFKLNYLYIWLDVLAV
jgi:hypothetical protein